MFARMVAKRGVWAHLSARAYWALTAVWSARIVVQSAPMGHQGGALGHGYGELHCCEHPFGLHRHAVPRAAFSDHMREQGRFHPNPSIRSRLIHP